MEKVRVLTVTRSTEGLFVPIKASSRLKYNCVAVSSSLVCLGTNTGSIYIFERQSQKLIKFIASKSGGIEIAKFSSDEKLLAVAESGGQVTCLDVDEERQSIKIIKEIDDHKGCKVTSLCWDDDSARLFIGDGKGSVTAIIVAPYKLPPGKLMSKTTVEVVIKGESPVVQLDYAKLKLLISTTTRTLLCMTDKSKFQQVGSKPRDGRFGSCFLQLSNAEHPAIYCARPGSRLWEVDFNGQVLATHQFKYLLTHPPAAIVGYRLFENFRAGTFAGPIGLLARFEFPVEQQIKVALMKKQRDNQRTTSIKHSDLPSSDDKWDKTQSFNFPRIFQLCKRFLVTWSTNGLYILDPSLGKVAGWFDQIRDIQDICCHGDTIFVLHQNGRITELEYLRVKECLTVLIGLEEWKQTVQIALQMKTEILSNVERYLTIDFREVLEKLGATEDATNKHLRDNLNELIEELEAKHNAVRAQIEERINRIQNPDDLITPSDSGVEDNDDVKSNTSEVISETSSSRLSFSRLAEVDMDSVLQRATSRLVSKIVSSGFVKKALREVLESEGVLTEESNRRSPVPSELPVGRKSPAAPAEPTPGPYMTQKVDTRSDRDTSPHPVRFPILSTRRKKKKAKVVTVDFESPTQDPSSGTFSRIPLQRGSSADLPPESPSRPQLRRYASLPPATVTDSDMPGIDIQSSVEASKEKPSNSSPTMIQKAKDLVRKVILPVPLSPLDVATKDTIQDNVDNPGARFKPSKESLKLITQLVDVTALSRNKLRDPRLMYNPKAVKDILQDWVNKLHEIFDKFTQQCISDWKTGHQGREISDREFSVLKVLSRDEFFFCLGAAFSEVSNVSMLCFETDTYPSQCDQISGVELTLLKQDSSLEEIRSKAVELKSDIAEKFKTMKDTKTPAKFDDCVVTDSEKANAAENNEEGSSDFTDSCKAEETSDKVKSILSDLKLSKDGPILFQKFCSESLLANDVEKVLCGTDEPATCPSCKDDWCRACFVLRYFPLLNFQKVRNVLRWKQKCRWRTWIATVVNLRDLRADKEVETAIQREDYGKVARLLRNLDNIEAFLASAGSLVSYSPTLATEYCIDGALKPWEVVHLFSTARNADCTEELLQYISNLRNTRKLTMVYQDPIVLVNTLHSALRSSEAWTNAYCSCGSAKPGAHLLTWDWGAIADDAINWLTRENPENVALLRRMRDIAKEFGYWKGLIVLYRELQDHKAALELMYQLGDFKLIVEYVTTESLKLQNDDWEHLFSTSSQAVKPVQENEESHSLHNCTPAVEDWISTITFEKCARKLVTETGAKNGLTILEKISDSRQRLSDDFYYYCAKMSFVESEQRSIIQKMLERMNSELWSERKSLVSKQIESFKTKELNGSLTLLDDDSVDEMQFEFKQNSPLSSSPNSSSWGVNLNLASSDCPTCTLPLCIQGSNASAGLVVFECGHVFHKQCIPEEVCLMCYYDDFLSV